MINLQSACMRGLATCHVFATPLVGTSALSEARYTSRTTS
jgi:hypothetical protein